MNISRLPPLITLSFSLLLSLSSQAGPRVEETKVLEQESPLSYQMPVREQMSAREDSRRIHRQVTVSFADLNLKHNSGLAALYQRLDKATTTVCGPREDGRNLALYRDQQRCLTQAMDTAVAKIGHLGLDDMHLARTGRRIDRGQAVAGR